jgi:hypothetical protein
MSNLNDLAGSQGKRTLREGRLFDKGGTLLCG